MQLFDTAQTPSRWDPPIDNLYRVIISIIVIYAYITFCRSFKGIYLFIFTFVAVVV